MIRRHRRPILIILFGFRFQERCFAAHSGSWLSFCCHTYSRVSRKSDLSQVSAMPAGPVFQLTALQPSIPVVCISGIFRGLNRGPRAAREGFYGFQTIYMWLFWAHLNFKWLNSLGNRIPLETEACLLHEGGKGPVLRERFSVYLAFAWNTDLITTRAFLTLRSDRYGGVAAPATARLRGVGSMLHPYLACYPLIKLLASLCLFEATGRLCKGCLVREISLVGRGVIASWKTRHYCSFFPSY